jgi:hypothetical protein
LNQMRPLFLQIVQSFSQSGFRGCLFRLCPCQKSIQNRFFQFQPLGISFFRGKALKLFLNRE